MSARLESLISALYRPGELRRVFAVSRAEAERLPVLETVAVISITASQKPVALLDGCHHLLRLSFADVDHLSSELSIRAREKISNAFTPAQAKEILNFVVCLPLNVRDVVVHCEGGYSRSAAVALALHKVLGFSAELGRIAEANPSIVHLIMEAGSCAPVRHKNPSMRQKKEK